MVKVSCTRASHADVRHDYPSPSSRICIYSQPFRAVPIHFSAACFVGALATDIAYWRTAEMMWTNFSSWLLTAGLLLGGTAAIGGIVDFATGRLSLRGGMGLLYALGNLDTRPTGRTYRRQDRGC
ncbi:DUF2231 domain-containing protein [Rhizobium laguerreae]